MCTLVNWASALTTGVEHVLGLRGSRTKKGTPLSFVPIYKPPQGGDDRDDRACASRRLSTPRRRRAEPLGFLRTLPLHSFEHALDDGSGGLHESGGLHRRGGLDECDGLDGCGCPGGLRSGVRLDRCGLDGCLGLRLDGRIGVLQLEGSGVPAKAALERLPKA